MANTSNLSSFLTDVADAIREKKGTQDQIPAGNFDTEIKSIETGTKINNQDKDITKNGTYTADEGYTGLGTVIVNVPQTGDVPVKLFKTKEEMNSSTGNVEGDLALVYKNEQQNMTADMEVTAITFPETVTLPAAFTDSAYGRLRAVDSSVMFDGNCMLNKKSFSFDSWSESGMIRASYTSTDGITYTRTRLQGDNPIKLPTAVKGDANEWNDNFGYFMQVGTSVFEGIYKYRTNLTDMSNFHFPKLSSLTFNDSNTPSISEWYDNYYTVDSLEFLCNKIIKEFSLTAYTPWFYLNNNQELCFITGSTTGPYIAGPLYDENKNFLGIGSNDMSYQGTMSTYRITDIATGTYEKLKDYTGIAYYQDDYYIPLTDISTMCCTSNSNKFRYCGTVLKNNSSSSWGELTLDWYKKYNSYEIAPTQLTATPGDVYKKSFYGSNGVETGVLAQNISNSFNDANADIYSKIQNQYENMEPRILTDSDKSIDNKIFIIPVKLDGTPLLDTSSVTDMSSMFYDCSNLTTIPQLDTSKVTDMRSTFASCTNLTTIPQLDTSNVTNMENTFASCSNLTTIPQLDTSNVINMENTFYGCSNLATIPQLDTSKVYYMRSTFAGCSNLTTIPQLNTSRVGDMIQMFSDCSNLTTIPQLNISNVKYYMWDMFHNCSSLSDDSLNIIMQMCINATSYTGTKTLKYIGLNSEQADKCKTLSNYSAFTSAGWTTGY